MKPYRLIPALGGVLLGFLATPTLSYGDRAAAERVVAFAAYVQEEIFDTSEYTIATGCKPKTGGGRKGLRGGTRCTFGEFCEHIWRDMKNGPGAPPTNVDWGDEDKDIADGRNSPENLIMKMMKMTTKTRNAEYDPNYNPKEEIKKGNKFNPKKKNEFTIINLKGVGFTGNADGKLMWPGMTPDKNEMKNYYNAMEHCGNRMADAFAENVANGNSLPKWDKDVFIKWIDNGRIGAELLYDLRRQDKWAAMYGVGDLDGVMGKTTVKTKVSSSFGYLSMKSPWDEMNIPETIKLYPGDDDAAKKAAFDAKWDVVKASEIYQNHETALDTAQKIKVQLAGCKM